MQHSAIGPSSLARLLACPASYGLSKAIAGSSGDSSGSQYASQGTVAHSIVEAALSNAKDGPKFGDVVNCEGHMIDVDREMIDGTNIMIDYCETLAKTADKTWIETRVDMGFLWDGNPPEPFFGTVDFAAYEKGTATLHVVDFKYGRVSVSPYDNAQGFAYATGALHELGLTPAWVTITIVQPRGMDGPPIKTALISGLDLLMWQQDELVPGIDRLYEPRPSMATGDHCKFCKAKIGCPALKNLAQDLAKTDFPGLPADPIHMSDDELGIIMAQAAVLQMWIKEVQAETSGRIEKGHAVPGWKLVPKRASRKWTDEDEILAEIKQARIKGGITEKPLSPTQMEKLNRAFYDDMVEAGYMSQVSSGTTLAPEVDPRDAIVAVTAQDEFDFVDG